MTDDEGLVKGDDGWTRCWWCAGTEEYRAYHDLEWGRPVTEDRVLFEKICLEGFQSGLSWLTILRKRENFRRAFEGFDIHAVALFRPAKVESLLQDAGIVRHRGKIQSVINNALRAQQLQSEFGSLSNFVWPFQPDPADRPEKLTKAALTSLAATAASKRLSAELKRRGWSYVGPTTVYAFMQAMGLVNDHLEGCYTRSEITRLHRQGQSGLSSNA